MKDLDRFDMILQAFEYETAECRPSTDLEEFFTSCEGVIIVKVLQFCHCVQLNILDHKITVNIQLV